MGFRTPPNHQDRAAGFQPRNNISTAVQFGYVQRRFEDYLGNVGERQYWVNELPNQENSAARIQEFRAFFFLTVVLAPALAVALVGGYGFLIWIYQLIAGPPGSV